MLGQFEQALTYNNKTSQQRIYVVKGLKTNLLGLPGITALQLASRVDSAEDYHTAILTDYPSLFRGLGDMGEPYETKLAPNARPYALFSPGRVPYPLHDKVQKELSCMEASSWGSSPRLKDLPHGVWEWWPYQRSVVQFASVLISNHLTRAF